MKSYRFGKSRYVSVDDLLARIALAATAVGVAMDTGKISRDVAKGALGALMGIKDGLDAL